MLSWGGTGTDTEPLTPLGRFLAFVFPTPEVVEQGCIRTPEREAETS